MSHWELSEGLTDDYYTPKPVFSALGDPLFDMDVAAAADPSKAFVEARQYISSDSLGLDWKGFVWCNPPYGTRGSKMVWVSKMVAHGNGLFLTPDRSNADWWQLAGMQCSAMLTCFDKIKFIRPDLGEMKQPGTGNSIFAFGEEAVDRLRIAQANNFGMIWKFTKL